MFEQFAGEISQVCTFRVFVQVVIYGTSYIVVITSTKGLDIRHYNPTIKNHQRGIDVHPEVDICLV